MILDSRAPMRMGIHHPNVSVFINKYNNSHFLLVEEEEESPSSPHKVPVSALPHTTSEQTEEGETNLGQGEIERAFDSLAAY